MTNRHTLADLTTNEAAALDELDQMRTRAETAERERNQALDDGYDTAVTKLRSVHDRTGSPAAQWAADYLSTPSTRNDGCTPKAAAAAALVARVAREAAVDADSDPGGEPADAESGAAGLMGARGEAGGGDEPTAGETAGQRFDLEGAVAERDAAIRAVETMSRYCDDLAAKLTEAADVIRQATAERDQTQQQLTELHAERKRLRDELRDTRNDLLNVRGILSPNGRPRRVPDHVPMAPQVAPAVQWLVDELERLQPLVNASLDTTKETER